MAEINKTYDVAIVGAGPAGSSLAFWLAQAGLKVILIDKEHFPRKKVCAGGLPNKVLDILPFDIRPVIEKEIFQVNLVYKLQEEFTRSYHKALVHTVNREIFDDFLVQKGKSIGVEFSDDQRIIRLNFEKDYWTVATSDKTIKAKVIVGADGANSFVAKNIGLNPIDFLDIGIQVEIPIQLMKKDLNGTIALDWGSIRNGYAWVFPKNNLLSIGVKGPAILGKQLKAYLLEVLSYFQIKTENFNLRGHLVPHRISKKPISREQALLVGDAAGMVDYWTGEGIFYAIKSSQLAAQQIERFFGGDQKAFENFEIAVNKEILPELITSYHFSRIFNYLSPMAFRIIRKYDYPWDVFCRIMRGDRTFVEVKKRFRPDIFLRKLLFRSQRANFKR